MEYYSAIKKNKITASAAAWMDLEILILSEVSQTKKRQMSCDTTYMWDLKSIIQMNIFIKQNYTHRLRKNPYDYQMGKVERDKEI